MKHDDAPTPNTFRDLRRAYQRQRYEGDLGMLIEPARRRTIWPAFAAAALLAICGLLGWQAAVHFRAGQPLTRDIPAPIDRAPQMHTLELTDPAQSLAAEPAVERRPVLPGLLVMSSPRATPPPRPTYATRPSMALLGSKSSFQRH